MTNNILGISNLDDLAKIVSNCRGCALYKDKTNDVLGAGSVRAEIMFIGEAPGKKEDETGEPFVGAAGKFLTEMLGTINLSREDIYIANVLKHRPPKNRDPKPAEIAACKPYLSKQIEIIKPKLIVFLGRHALNRFFPEAQISDVHGTVLKGRLSEIGLTSSDKHEQYFLALYHPAAALYNGGMRQTLIDDFSKIPKIIKKIKTKELIN